MTTQLLTLAAAAVLSSGTLAALIGWWKDRRRDTASADSLAVTASGDAVTTILRVLAEVRQQLDAAHAEIAALRAEVAAWERYAAEIEDKARRHRAQLEAVLGQRLDDTD